MLTAQEVGIPFTPAAPREQQPPNASASPDQQPPGDGVTRRHGPQSLGLLGYLRSTLQRYDDEGHNLSRVAALQSMTRDQSAGFSQAAEVMQQYTRLVLLTIEAIAAAGHPLNRQLQAPVIITSPTGYAAALSSDPPGDAAGDAARRRMAVHLLVAFMGAILGSSYSQRQFIAAAADAYDSGFAAAELFNELADDEFLQVGGLLPVGGPEPGAERAITRQLFAR